MVEEIWRLLVETKKTAGLMEKSIDTLPYGVEAIGRSLSIVNQYAHEQKIIPRPFAIDELFDSRMRALEN